MIDLIRLYSTRQSEFEGVLCDINNEFPYVLASHDYHTGEFHYPIKTAVKNFNLHVSAKRFQMWGSIHKYFNLVNGDGNQNHNDFSYSNLKFSIERLLTRIPLLGQCSLTQLEFGFNIKIDELPSSFIKNKVHLYEFKTHKEFTHKKNHILKRFYKENYEIKIYSKSEQYGIQDKNILRVEIKFTNSKEFRKLGIYWLEDLLDKNNLEKLFTLLKTEIGKLIIVDTQLDGISKYKSSQLQQYVNSDFWRAIPKRAKKRKYYRHRDNCIALLNESKINEDKMQILALIDAKFQQLINS